MSLPLRTRATTHTFALMEVSPEVYREVRRRLEDAGYQHAIMEVGGAEVLDMHGIALKQEEE